MPSLGGSLFYGEWSGPDCPARCSNAVEALNCVLRQRYPTVRRGAVNGRRDIGVNGNQTVHRLRQPKVRSTAAPARESGARRPGLARLQDAVRHLKVAPRGDRDLVGRRVGDVEVVQLLCPATRYLLGVRGRPYDGGAAAERGEEPSCARKGLVQRSVSFLYL